MLLVRATQWSHSLEPQLLWGWTRPSLRWSLNIWPLGLTGRWPWGCAGSREIGGVHAAACPQRQSKVRLPWSPQTNASLLCSVKTSSSSQDRVTGWVYFPDWNHQKSDNTCETRVFKELDTRLQRTTKPERWEQMRWVPQLAAWGECPGHSAWRGPRWSLVGNLSWGCWELGKPRQLQFVGQRTREKHTALMISLSTQQRVNHQTPFLVKNLPTN